MTDEFMTRIGSIAVTDRLDLLFLPTVNSWAQFISRSVSLADPELEGVATNFRDDLGEDVLNGVDTIRKSPELVILLSLSSMVEMNRQQHADPRRISLQLALLGPAGADNVYKQFMKTVRQLVVKTDFILPPASQKRSFPRLPAWLFVLSISFKRRFDTCF